MASHPFESAREATLSALTELAKAESRIAALWLQGSLAAGGADPFSDIDAYLAIRDDDYDAVWGDREGLLTRLGGALAWSNATTPGLAAVHALKAMAARDVAALKAVQLRIHDALVEAGQAACAALGVDYPIDAASERAVRDLIEASWPAG